jgi:uncharacterized protein involved in outer membrane biogenesis
MKKIALLGLILLVLFALAVPRLVSLYIGPEAIRTATAQFLGRYLGREVSVRGQARILLYPRPSIVIENVSVANPPGFEGELFYARQARLDFRLARILSRRIELESLTLFGATLGVVYDGQGESNLRGAFIGVKEALAEEKPKGETELPSGFVADGSNMRITLADGEIGYRDPGRGTSLRLTGLHISLDPGGHFSAGFVTNDAVPGAVLEAKVVGSGAIDAQTGMEFRDSRLSVAMRDAAQAGRPDKPPLAAFGALCDFSQATERLEMRSVSLTLAGAQLTGAAALSHIADRDKRSLEFSLAGGDFDLGMVLAAFPGLGAGPSPLDMGLYSSGTLTLDRLKLGDLAVRQIAAKLRLGADRAFSGSATGKLADGDFKAETALASDAEATNLTLSFEAVASGPGNKGVFGGLRARIAATGVSGRLDVRDTLAGEASRAFGFVRKDLARFDAYGPLFLGLSFTAAPPAAAGETGIDLSDIEWRWPEFEAKGKASLVLPPNRGGSLAEFAAGIRGLADLALSFGQAQPKQAGPAAKAVGAKPVPQQPPKLTAKVQFAPHVPEPKAAKNGPAFDVTAQLGFDDAASASLVRAEVGGQAVYDTQADSWRLRNARVEGKAEARLGASPASPVARAGVKGRLEADLTKGGLDISQAALDFGFAKGEGKLSLAGLWDDPKFTGEIGLAEFSPRQAVQAFGLAVPAELAPKALTKARGSFELAADAGQIAVRKLRLLIDATNLTGQAAYAVKTRAVTFDLDADEIELANYLPSPPPNQSKTLTGRGGQADKAYNTAWWRDLNIDGRARVSWFRREGLVFKRPDFAVTLKNGQFRASMRSGDFYGGRFSADLRGQALDRGMSSCADLKLDEVDADAFLRDLTGDEVVTGRGTASVSVCGKGESEAAWWREVAGSAGLVVRNGVLPLRESGKTPKNPKDVETVAFRIMSASFRIDKGLAVTEDVVLDGPKLAAKGKGWVNLVDETLDLALSAVYEGSPKVPVGIKGPVLDPKLDIDRSAAVGETIFRVFDTIISTPENTYKILRKFIF